MRARTLAAAVLATSLSLPLSPALAETLPAPEPTTAPALSEHMAEADQSWYDSLQEWMDARYQQKAEEPVTTPSPDATETDAPEPTESASAEPTATEDPAPEPTEDPEPEPTAEETTPAAEPTDDATEDTTGDTATDTETDAPADGADPGTVTVGDDTTDEGTGDGGTSTPPRTGENPGGDGAAPEVEETTAPEDPATEDPAEEEPAPEDEGGFIGRFKEWFTGWFDDWFRENYADELDGEPAPEPTQSTIPQGTATPIPEDTAPAEDPATPAEEVQVIVDGHNAHRESRGLAPLTVHPEATTVAQEWSESMAAEGQLVHNPDYAAQLPEEAAAVGENIALISGTGTDAAQQAVAGWIASPDHESNIVGGYTHLGVGVATNDAGETFYTVNFLDLPEDQEHPPAVEEPVEGADPTEAPSDGTPTTGGTGGTGTAEGVSFTSAGLTSEYHIYVPDTPGPHGLVMWADGSGGHGFDNPDQSYLIGGAEGMAAQANARNMILVVPVAPAPGCPSDNCWYDENGEEKAQWSSDLMTHVKSQYDIDQDRIVVGGYSSGAQWAAQFFVPAYGEAQSVDLAVVVGGGGAPRTDAQFSPDYAASTVVVHNTGTADNEDGYNAYADAQDGEEWYRTNGFTTDPDWPQGVDHSRGEEFGGILGAAVDEHLS